MPFLEYYLTQDSIIQESYFSLQDRGAYLIQLLGVFMTGSGITNSIEGMQGAMPITIGFSLTIGMAIMTSCLIMRYRWKIMQEKNYPVWRSFFLIAAVNLALTLRYFPWRVIQLRLGIGAGELGQIISSIQFPWRWLTPVSALLAFGTIMALMTVKKISGALYRGCCCALMLFLAISTGYLYHQYSDVTQPMRTYAAEDDGFTDDLWFFLSGTNVYAYEKPQVNVTRGEAQIDGYDKARGVAVLEVSNPGKTPAEVTLPLYAYRHYKAEDHQGKIEICFAPPVYWRAAEAISLLSLLGVVAAYLMHARRDFSRGQLKKS